MSTRAPAVAGQFYPASPDECRAEVEQYEAEARAHAADAATPSGEGLRPCGGIVPHAGWICSGAVAASVIAKLAAEGGVDTFVVFGAQHRLGGRGASVYPGGTWLTPLGEIAIDEPLASAVLEADPGLVDAPSAHVREHSIEVQVPFIQHEAPAARLLPILVPPDEAAPQVGRVVADEARALGRQVVFVGSTDLTHYGPRYQFTPRGVGPDALRWAKEVNDRRLLDVVDRLDAERVVPEAEANRNACGSGAVAATIAACRSAGADTACLLWHTTSAEVLQDRMGRMSDSVGYAGVVFGQSPRAAATS